MDPETLEKVRKKLSGTFEGEQADLKKGGFGLNNVAQRLRMYYGDQAEILVESEKGIGTCFKIFSIKKHNFFQRKHKNLWKTYKKHTFLKRCSV